VRKAIPELEDANCQCTWRATKKSCHSSRNPTSSHLCIRSLPLLYQSEIHYGVEKYQTQRCIFGERRRSHSNKSGSNCALIF
jgi:hypothetical protein